MIYDVVIVGGGPGGLSAALALGRARKRVLLCDAGPRRNVAATQIHNFVTRDGTPPEDFRRIGRQQLVAYPNVTVQDVGVDAIGGTRGAFRVSLASGTVEARRIVLCTGMVDEMLSIEGFRELWGQSIFQCPYCHAWEVQDRPWAYLPGEAGAQMQHFALQARGWTSDVVVFTGGKFEVPPETSAILDKAGIRIETAPIARLLAHQGRLQAVELPDGTAVPCEVMFTHPPQRQVALVSALGLALDDVGFVKTDAMTRETSVAGIYAAGDLTTRMQGAVHAAAAAGHAVAVLNAELTAEMAMNGMLRH